MTNARRARQRAIAAGDLDCSRQCLSLLMLILVDKDGTWKIVPVWPNVGDPGVACWR
jgi:hypothetical protein